jgi:OOP family OmpA-OmpF porin
VSDARSGPDARVQPPSIAPAESAADADRPHDDHLAFAELRALLVGRERDQLAAILERLDDAAARRREVADILPHVLVEHTSDPRFTHALTPPVERAITASVRSNPAPLADALFPVMGPAIRKAVAAALASMVEGLNRTLEHSLSWRSFAWRFEALRTGKSFGEVMLLHTLVYRVEQVFLIHRDSGLLLQHVAAGADEVKDADMVSGMLTAIRDFVQDSFRVGESESLEAMKVGELSVWVEQGPKAMLAAVLRGTAPRTYRTTLQTALERIHLEFADEFEQFSGDTARFDGARPTLDTCLHTEYRADARPNHRTLWAAAALVLVALAAAGAWSWRARSRWNAYVDTLRAEPGLIVLTADRGWRSSSVTGLRDPLARDPAALLAATTLSPGRVQMRWEPYHAATPSLALARATQVLQPPPGIALDLRDGRLTAAGDAPLAWLAEASRLAPLIPGVTSFDVSAAEDAAARAASVQLEQLSPLFVKGQARLADGQDAVLRQLLARTAEMVAAAQTLDRRFRVDVIGHTDADGAPEANLPLSRQRAAVIASAMRATAGDRLDIVDSGVGSDDPAVASASEADKQRNRRVTIRVTAIPAQGAAR